MEAQRAKQDLYTANALYAKTRDNNLLIIINKIKMDIASDVFDAYECGMPTSFDLYLENYSLVKETKEETKEVTINFADKNLETELTKCKTQFIAKYANLNFEFESYNNTTVIIAKDNIAKTYDLKEALKKSGFKFDFTQKFWYYTITLKYVDVSNVLTLLKNYNVKETETTIEVYTRQNLRYNNLIFNFDKNKECYILNKYSVI